MFIFSEFLEGLKEAEEEVRKKNSSYTMCNTYQGFKLYNLEYQLLFRSFFMDLFIYYATYILGNILLKNLVGKLL